MIDPRLTLAIGNAVDVLCEKYVFDLPADRRSRVISKIEQRIEAGEPHDLVFSYETLFIARKRPA